MKWTVPVSAVGLALVAAVVWYVLSLHDRAAAIGKVSAAASAAAAVGGLLAFVVLVVYTAETQRLRIAAERQLESQHQVQVDQVKLSLFDKRFLVYLTLQRFLSTLNELGKTHDSAQLLQDTNQAQFLFSPDIEEFLREVYRKAHHLQSFNEQETRASNHQMEPRPEPDGLAMEHSWLISEAPKLARQKFEEYLRLYQG